MVTKFLDNAQVDIPVPKAIIAPHAGYIYSGPIAARAYASLRPAHQTIRRVVLLGPAHRVYLQGLALSSASAFATPLGTIDIDLESVEKLRRLSQVINMDSAHDEEHSLEVHLPFLQRALDHFTLVPLVVGDASVADVSQVLDTVWGGEETLIVVSSDLSHYHDYETARRIDTATSNAIQNCQLEKIGSEQACGCIPMRGLLHIAKERAMQVRILDLRNSGDTAGTPDRVVGYGAYSLHLTQTLSSTQRRQLLELARQSIDQGFESGRPWVPDLDDYDPPLREHRATFVTLTLNATLRGCIGTTQAVAPLVESVAESAFNAAFRDPRFKPLTRSEFEQVKLSISVLSPPDEMEFSSEKELLEQLRPGSDGLIIEKGTLKATFLPAVWETITTPSDFLQQLKLKAGMAQYDVPDRAWRYFTESF